VIASDNDSNQKPVDNNNQYNSRSDKPERPRAGAMEVYVDHNIEKAMKILKRKLIKEGLFKELKSRRYYEKPSERKKRKNKESIKKVRKDEARQKKNSLLF
jgi:small subunit ribosomal protein S21